MNRKIVKIRYHQEIITKICIFSNCNKEDEREKPEVVRTCQEKNGQRGGQTLCKIYMISVGLKVKDVLARTQ